MKALKCRECGREYPLTATHVCEFDFGPLEVAYDYERIKKSLTREAIASRPKTMWRYRELLPLENEPTVGLQTGFTPLIRARRLAERLGVSELSGTPSAVPELKAAIRDLTVAQCRDLAARALVQASAAAVRALKLEGTSISVTAGAAS